MAKKSKPDKNNPTFNNDSDWKIKKSFSLPIKRGKPYTIENIKLFRTKTGYKLTLDSSRKLNGKEIREAIITTMQIL